MKSKKKMALLILCICLGYFYQKTSESENKEVFSHSPKMIRPTGNNVLKTVERKPALTSSKNSPNRNLNLNIKNSKQKTKEILRKLSSQGLEKRQRINGHDYLLMNDLKAIDKNKYKTEYGKQIAESAGYIIFKPDKEFETKVKVIRNLNNGMVGIVTGMVILVLNEGQEIDKINSNHSFKISYSADHLLTYYLEPSEELGVFEFAENLKEIQGVKSVKVEVIENIRKAK